MSCPCPAPAPAPAPASVPGPVSAPSPGLDPAPAPVPVVTFALFCALIPAPALAPAPAPAPVPHPDPALSSGSVQSFAPTSATAGWPEGPRLCFVDRAEEKQYNKIKLGETCLLYQENKQVISSRPFFKNISPR